MVKKFEYTCWKCDTKKKVPEGEEKPFCCGKVMKPTKICTTAASAEHSRTSDDDEPCDDSTGD